MNFNAKFVLTFLLISILFFYFSNIFENIILKIIYIWISISYLILSLIYFLNNPKLFIKNKIGQISYIIIFLMFPIFFLNYLVWYIHYQFSKEDKINHFFENFYIGKKVFYKDISNEIETVIDLTSEFSEHTKIVQNKNYISFPILDGSVPEKNELIKFLNKIKI